MEEINGDSVEHYTVRVCRPSLLTDCQRSNLRSSSSYSSLPSASPAHCSIMSRPGTQQFARAEACRRLREAMALFRPWRPLGTSTPSRSASANLPSSSTARSCGTRPRGQTWRFMTSRGTRFLTSVFLTHRLSRPHRPPTDLARSASTILDLPPLGLSTVRDRRALAQAAHGRDCFPRRDVSVVCRLVAFALLSANLCARLAC